MSVEFLLYIASGGGRVGSAIRTEYEAVFKEVLDKAEPGWTLPPLEYLKDDKHPKEWDIQEVYIQRQMRKLANEYAASPDIQEDNLTKPGSEEWRKEVGERDAWMQICPSFRNAVSAPETKKFFKQREADAKTKIEEIYEKCPATQDPKGVAVVKHVVKHMGEHVGEHVGELPLCGVVREGLGTLDMVLENLARRVHELVDCAISKYKKDYEDNNHADHSTLYNFSVRHLFGVVCCAWREAGEQIGRIRFDQCGASTASRIRLCTRTNAGEYVESQVTAYICKPLKDLKCYAGDVVHFRTATVDDEWLKGYEGVHTSRPDASVYLHNRKPDEPGKKGSDRWFVTRPIIEQFQKGIMTLAGDKRDATQRCTNGNGNGNGNSRSQGRGKGKGKGRGKCKGSKVHSAEQKPKKAKKLNKPQTRARVPNSKPKE